MGVRRFFLPIALTAMLVPGPSVRADLNYRAEISGAQDSDLADLLDKVSELKTLEDKPPASVEALRRRATAISAGLGTLHTASAFGMRSSRTKSTPRPNRQRSR
jgi:hypothetical protein